MNQFRELWGLINVNDSPGLTVAELESGMATVTRSEDFFDSLPAVQQAFRFTKIISNGGEDQENDNEGKSKINCTLEFKEFRMFLRILRQYYGYCQVCFWGKYELQQCVLKGVNKLGQILF